MKVKVLNKHEVKASLNMISVLEKVEEVYCLKARQKAGLWPLIFHEFQPEIADMDIKSGYINEYDVYGLKVVSWFSENRDKNLPMLFGTTLMFDMKTGAPIGILDAEHVTGMRTGAAGAIGAKFLARARSEDLLIVGTGHQAAFQIAATLIAMQNIKRVRICNPRNAEQGVKFVSTIKDILNLEFLSSFQADDEVYDRIKAKFEVQFIAEPSLEKAVSQSDIIITVTPSRKPLIMKSWLKEGVHISCMGSDLQGKQEIESCILKDAKIFVDDMAQAINVGELEIALKTGTISEDNIMGEIGELILSEKVGRTNDSEITIFDSTGIALQDLIVSKLAIDIAKEKNIGQEVDL
ncbi:ornithine cyclodeaminase family protein [Fusibacter ferrireducens]|uniref:Ornithine cyclodeaminase family protein n=1 Tax=Fusibacter ferrireducens TaxID=2785058 RepID=A0ABR9ZPQ7_9FIRM|nr:ornithine cyclodeaminase family protein [Fusibacter ferrireducens]MBF4692453.1 ornithine cyclodeaminase family protein [Fusibacter ferrireducens]